MSPTDAEQLEAEGDQLLADGKKAEALAKFAQAVECEGAHVPLYEKLLALHQELTTDWTSDDLAQSLDWEMQKQALEHPEVQVTHERLSPEWHEVTERLRRLIIASDEKIIGTLVDEIAAYGETAVRPLLDFILLLKTGGQEPTDTPPEGPA